MEVMKLDKKNCNISKDLACDIPEWKPTQYIWDEAMIMTMASMMVVVMVAVPLNENFLSPLMGTPYFIMPFHFSKFGVPTICTL